MPARRASTRRSSRFDSPATTATNDNATGLDTPGLDGGSTPATGNPSTPGTSPGASDKGAARLLKGKGRHKRALATDGELSEADNASVTIRGESAYFECGSRETTV